MALINIVLVLMVKCV